MTPINKVASAFALTAGVLFAAFVMLWIITGDARIAATIVVSSSLTVLLLGVGWAASHLSHMARREPAVDASYAVSVPTQLPAPEPQAPRFLRQPDGVMVNRDVLLQDAAKILRLRDAGFPAPRRNLIETHLGTTDHERIRRAMDYLAAIGEVTPAVDGGKREWISPAEVDHD